jgi:hypothetical protein
MQKTIGLLLGAAAAYGIYKYSKLSAEQKRNLKEKGRDFLNKNMKMGNMFGKKETAANNY